MPTVCCAVSDLIFGTKIVSTAQAVGTPIEVIRTREDLLEKLDGDVTLILIDLNLAGADPIELIRAARSCSAAPIVAFVSHVETSRAQDAEKAGAHEVMPRSRFSARLPKILQDAAANKPAS